ncbi:MAG: alpha/beta hydrolase [Tannerellaceae bacterium]|jgi:dienelactone hydrolase|nr:alpha/beta hydrolase [Tannerellaceae bacterium]
MTQKKIIFFLLLAICCFPAQAGGADEVLKQTFVYSIKGNDSLRLDKYNVPLIQAPKPCLIFVFGGGFAIGSRDYESYISFYEQFARQGYVVVAIDYRLGMKDFKKTIAPDMGQLKLFKHLVRTLVHTLDIAVEDLFDATNYVLEHASEWGVRPEALISCGSSAGAITVLQGEYEICSGGRLSERLPQGFNYAGVISFAGAIFSQKGHLKWIKKPAPIQLFHGDMDREVPYDKLKFRQLGFFGSRHIAAQFEQLGYPYYFYSVENATHEMAGKPMTENLDEINTFIDKLVFKKENLMIHTCVKPTLKSGAKKKPKLKDYMTNYL